MSALKRAARSFGNFWWDFLVGDTPEFFVFVLVLIAVAFAVRSVHAAAYLLLPLLTVVVLVASTVRGRKASTGGVTDASDADH